MTGVLTDDQKAADQGAGAARALRRAGRDRRGGDLAGRRRRGYVTGAVIPVDGGLGMGH